MKVIAKCHCFVSKNHYICRVLETKRSKMDFLTFKERMYPMGCFNINQVLLWEKDFDRFPEYRQVPDFSRYVANRIYAPSYISLHSALSFYGMIPEEVVQLTSVTTLKTARFENDFGTFHYQNVKTPFYFGFEIKTIQSGRGLLFATPEKALLDLLYLNPYYKTEQDMEELRLDEDYMQNELNRERLMNYLSKIESKTMEQKVKRLMKVYEL